MTIHRSNGSDPFDFPITEVIPQIRETLRSHTRLVLEAPPGAGKTTQVPLALLNEAWCQHRKILMLEPRRVAARAAAGAAEGWGGGGCCSCSRCAALVFYLGIGWVWGLGAQ